MGLASGRHDVPEPERVMGASGSARPIWDIGFAVSPMAMCSCCALQRGATKRRARRATNGPQRTTFSSEPNDPNEGPMANVTKKLTPVLMVDAIEPCLDFWVKR